MPKVIYKNFEFPLEAVLSYLQPHKKWVTWVQEQAEERQDTIDLSTAPFQSMGIVGGLYTYTATDTTRFVFGLIESGAGSAFCPTCNQRVPAALVKLEEYAEGTMMAGIRGRKLSCPNEHELLREDTQWYAP